MASLEDLILWFPAEIFSQSPKSHKDFALIILNQPLSLRPSLYSTLWANSIYKVAADGGANRLHELNASSESPDLDIDLVIGDLDSLSLDARKYWEKKGVEIVQDHDQDSTDFGKAYHKIRKEREGELNVVVLGGLGGRIDQGLSTLHHIYMFQPGTGYEHGKMLLLSSEAITFLLKAGKHKIKARDIGVGMKLGKHVGIIPMKEASVISTKGLEWDVQEWKTEFGGQMSTSNHVREEWVEIETSKDVLFTIDIEILGDYS
jgi:thiamine pyrophosphokinase